MVTDLGSALQAERNGDARILVNFGNRIEDFHVFVAVAHDDVIKNRPDSVRRFLKAWFETIAYMRDNKAEVVRIAVPVTGMSESVANREYDFVMPSFSLDGKFNVKGLEPIARSL